MDPCEPVSGREPLSAAELRDLRAAALPGGLRLQLSSDPHGRRLERLDALNRRRLLSFGGVRKDERGPCEVVYALSDAGRAVFRLH